MVDVAASGFGGGSAAPRLPVCIRVVQARRWALAVMVTDTQCWSRMIPCAERSVHPSMAQQFDSCWALAPRGAAGLAGPRRWPEFLDPRRLLLPLSSTSVLLQRRPAAAGALGCLAPVAALPPAVRAALQASWRACEAARGAVSPVPTAARNRRAGFTALLRLIPAHEAPKRRWAAVPGSAPPSCARHRRSTAAAPATRGARVPAPLSLAAGMLWSR